MSSVITINVFKGGGNSQQVRYFDIALGKHCKHCRSLNVAIEANYLTVEDIRQRRMTVEQFATWLSNADIYFILSHPAQGIAVLLEWDFSQVGAVLYTHLHNRIGYPAGEELQCSVFLQDKFAYLNACSSICNPSLRIERTEDGHLSEDVKREIYRFCCRHFEIPASAEAKGGWVLKAPFTTNSKGIKWCQTLKSIVDNFFIQCENREMIGVPYFILQPRLANRKEYKVVLLENEMNHSEIAPFLAKNHVVVRSTAFCSDDSSNLFQLAQAAKDMLKVRIPCLSTPILRVDIMQTQLGTLIVNEFESLEALFSAAGRMAATHDAASEVFLIQYWEQKLELLISRTDKMCIM